MPPGNAISTRTNSANSITSVQLTGTNGVTRPSSRPSATPPSKRADRIAEAAEHGDDETLELIAVAGKDGEGKQRCDQHARHAGERDTHADRDGEEPRRRNADQLCGLAVIGDRAHRLAGAGVVQEQIKQRGDHRRQHGGKNMRAGKRVTADGDAGQRHLDIEQRGAPHRGADADQDQIDGEGR